MEFGSAWMHLSIFEICVWFCTSTNAAMLPFALLRRVLSREACDMIEGCIQRMVDFKRPLTVCAHLQVLLEEGFISEKAWLGLLQTQVSQMEWMCFQVAAVNSCEQSAASDSTNCMFCPHRTAPLSIFKKTLIYHFSMVEGKWVCLDFYLHFTLIPRFKKDFLTHHIGFTA